MKIEVRSDTEARITGYVNATEKKSRPVVTPHGKVVEIIEPRAFEQAIEAGYDSITLNVDHDKGSVYARTSDGTLSLKEDAIGLHADVLIRDPVLIGLAREGKIRGWSFGMYNVRDSLEQRGEGELPIRHISGLDLDHVSLIVNQTPVYSATSVEVRAEGGDLCTELRSGTETAVILETRAKEPEPTPEFDNSDYHKRLDALNRKEH
jgi:hypothetical protein